ncbi:hypothetical protein RHGRI_032985 [Rhododendron griersonianum]|uniref:Alpha-1,3-mannosyl-glycoprotein 2-beta-N-acetylglucosaminyltransferase n=1 Tax=Rhododendron griersonianum TaxID=479676 RepID=A0AAV6IEJ3_9ERIC|nr:hypothetical protein RHGRI_032985 [Rhododendron griersonianum]
MTKKITYWDDWLRLKENHKGRQFIRPEVCRTYNFGEHVDWKSMNLSYLMEDQYVTHFADMVKNARPIHGTDAVLKVSNIDGDVRILYKDQEDFERIARQFGIFEEWKDGVPRTAYKGVVVFRYQTRKRVFLVGPESLQQLGIE